MYHEQLIRVIAETTGCSLDDADYIRRHLDSERPSLPDDPDGRPARKGLDGPRNGVPAENDVGRWFVRSARANGFTSEQATALWKEVYAFASFGFCKSHAAAFALPTYVSAWFKAHYPAEFLAGLLTHDPGMYPRRVLVSDARHAGIPILPVDVNRSEGVYRAEPVEGGPMGIRLALSEVRDISEAEIDSIVEGRCTTPYSSLEDLWRRTDLSRPVLENLAHVGAMDSIEPDRTRRELLWRAVELSTRPRPRRGAQGQLGLDEPVGASLFELSPYGPARGNRSRARDHRHRCEAPRHGSLPAAAGRDRLYTVDLVA